MPLARYAGNGRENPPTPTTPTLCNPPSGQCFLHRLRVFPVDPGTPQSSASSGIDPKLTAKMTLVDLVIIVLVLLMALPGFARGFLVGAAALAGFIGGAYHRLADRAAAAVRRLALTLCSTRQPRRRGAPRWPRRRALRGSGAQSATLHVGAGATSGRRHARGDSDGLHRTGPGMDRGRRPTAGQQPVQPPVELPPEPHALRDPARPQQRAATIGFDPECARPHRPAAGHQRPCRQRPCAQRGDPPGPGSDRGAGLGRADPRNRLQPWHRGQRLGRRQRSRRHQRPRRRRRAFHDRAASRCRTAVARRAWSSSIRTTTSRSCASRV